MQARMQVELIRLKGTPVCGFLLLVDGKTEVLEFTAAGVDELVTDFEKTQCKVPDTTGLMVDQLLAVSDGIRAFCENVKSVRRELGHLRNNPGIPNTDDNAIATLYQQTHTTINWEELIERVPRPSASVPPPPPAKPGGTEAVRR